jgi:hypothetical protein
LKMRLATGFAALLGVIVFLMATGDFWRAPRRTMAELPTKGLDEAWRLKANSLLPRGTDDRVVERKLEKAGLTVAPRNDPAYLVMEEAGCVRMINATWTLDGQRHLDHLTTWSQEACE